MPEKECRITVFSDYICPFCYIGHHRLARLNDCFTLKINWAFIEIHPETDPAGEPVASLQYPSQQWQKMMRQLDALAEAEGITMREHDFTTNSQQALQLAESIKTEGRDTFYRLHERLFEAFFVDGLNIGSREVLQQIAQECGISSGRFEQAMDDEAARQRRMAHYQLARQYGIEAVPSFVFGEEKLTGVVSEKRLRQAAQAMTQV